MINKLKNYWEILIVLFLGLTPILWYKDPNSLALGHDMGFPIDPLVFFKDRLFVWTDRVGLGWDQALGSAAVLIHGLEAFISTLGFSIFTTQKLVFIFWFVLPGLAMYYFVSTLHKDKSEWFIRLSASLFYMFNHFLLQAWFIAERTKFSLLVALPILLGLLIGILEKRLSLLTGSALFALTLFFFNGGGGIPLYGGLILTLIIAFFFFGFIQIKKNGRGEIKRLALVACSLIGSFILVNVYWILPIAVNTLSSYKQNLGSIGGISGILAWSFEISKFASILNVARLQGIPDWYDNPNHPYSSFFLNNPILIIISFIIPIVVFSSLFIVKKYPEYRRFVIFFNILAIFGIIFTAGSHPPFGFIYNFFLSFVPGFAIFRTPFYKFAPALWFAYSYLFSFASYILIREFKKPKFMASTYIKNASYIVILSSVLAYSFPFFTGSFFQWQKPFSTMVKLPPYVLDFDKWINNNLSYNDRVITLPKLNSVWYAAIYKWAYWSTAPLASLLTDRSVITNDRVMSENEILFMNSFYDSIAKGSSVWRRISELVGINYFLLQDDFNSNARNFETDKPTLYKEKLTSLEGITKKQSFGQWDVYQIGSNNPKKMFLSSNTSLVLTKKNLSEELFDVNSIFLLPNSEGENFYFTNEAEKKKIPNKVFSRVILIANCLYCDRREKEIDLIVPKPQILPGSIFYQLVKNKERKEEKKFKSDPSRQVDFYLGVSLKRIGEVKQLVLSRVGDEDILFALEGAKEDVSKIVDIVDKMDKSETSTQLEVLKINNFLRSENRILNRLPRESISSKIQDQIEALREYIAATYQRTTPFEFIYPPDRERHYDLNIEASGNYEVLLQRKDFGEELSFQKIILDGQGIIVKPIQKNSYYLSLGKIFLSSGRHNLKFEIDEGDNLLKETEDFSITPTNRICKTIVIDKIYPNHRYTFNFNYVTERGKDDIGPVLKIGQLVDKREVLLSKVKLGLDNIPQAFNTDIVTKNNVNKLKISICPSPGYETSSVINISNLNLQPVIMPVVTAILDNSTSKSIPSYSIHRVDQTKYKVTVKEADVPYFLVLNTRFNSNWRIGNTLIENFLGESITVEKHLVINGFANGWLIDKKGDYSLTVEYTLQQYFYLGWVVTIVFLLLAVSYLIFVKYYEYKNRKD